ncbi:MAG: hypothetical protein LBH47_01850, partial [Christensenellaceae bacterium]|nr:hypothetical protein [Christensenellaceae bacterium]
MEKLKELNRLYFGTGISKKGSIPTMGLGLDFLSMLLKAKTAENKGTEEITHILNGKGYGVDERQADELIANEKEVLKPIIKNLDIQNYNIVEPKKLLRLQVGHDDIAERIKTILGNAFISDNVSKDYLLYQTLITKLIEDSSKSLIKLGYAEPESVLNPELYLMKNLGEGT